MALLLEQLLLQQQRMRPQNLLPVGLLCKSSYYFFLLGIDEMNKQWKQEITTTYIA